MLESSATRPKGGCNPQPFINSLVSRERKQYTISRDGLQAGKCDFFSFSFPVPFTDGEGYNIRAAKRTAHGRKCPILDTGGRQGRTGKLNGGGKGGGQRVCGDDKMVISLAVMSCSFVCGCIVWTAGR